MFPLGSRTHGAETTCAPWQGAAAAACCNPESRSLSCFLLRSPSARVQVPEEPDPEPCLRLAPSEKLQAPCLRHTPPTAVPPSTPCTTTFPLRNRRTTTSRPILTLVRRIIFPRTYALGLRPAQRRELRHARDGSGLARLGLKASACNGYWRMPQNYASAAQEFARLSSEGAGPCPHCPKPVRLRGLAHWLRSSWSRTSAMSGCRRLLRYCASTLSLSVANCPPCRPLPPEPPNPRRNPPARKF